MSAIAYLLDRDIQASVTTEGGLNLKGLSGLSEDTRQEVISFARQNKEQIMKSLNQDTEPQGRADRTNPENTREFWDSMIRCPAGTVSKQVETKHPGTESCPACVQSQWWHKNEPNAKLICGRCHPPAPGLDVIFNDYKGIERQ